MYQFCLTEKEKLFSHQGKLETGQLFCREYS